MIVDKNDPLPAASSEGHSNRNEEEEDVQKPVYNPEVKTGSSILNPEVTDSAILGMKLEVFMGMVIGGLIVFIVAVGIVYNVFRKKDSEKDIELEFESGSEDESSARFRSSCEHQSSCLSRSFWSICFNRITC